jgi:hypothetical protein
VPRYRIEVAGMPSSRLVRFLQALIPVLRETPSGVLVTVKIEPDEEAEDG